MYPFKDDEIYARNQWYVAAWSDELGRDGLLERWFLGEPVVMYRTEEGKAVAVDGRCPHRNYPLSKGVLRGDDIECGYHGITFAPSGECVRVPSQDKPPASCKIRAYPVEERGFMVWIWTGDPAAANPELIPSYDELRLDKEGWVACQGFSVDLKARYQLLNENLMDISHLSFLHAGSIGTEALAATEVQITEHPRFVRGSRRMKDDVLTGFFANVLGYEGKVDRITLIDYYPPSVHVAWEMFLKPGALERVDENGGQLEGNEDILGMFRVHHMLSPATRHRSNYLIAYSRDFALEDASVTKVMTEVFQMVIQQDVDAVEAIEALLQNREAEPRDVMVKADAHSIRGRRILESIIRDEGESTRPAD